MTTALDHFASARKLNAQAAATLSPEQRREQARANLADIRQLTSRYTRDGRLDRAALRSAWADVCAAAASVSGAITQGGDEMEIKQTIEQVAIAASAIARELGGK